MTDVAGLLREVPLFASFAADELRAVAARCAERRYDKGETVWTVGEPADELLIVSHGELAVWSRDEVVAHLGPGDCAGEIALLLDEARSATVTATRPTLVLVLGSDDFDAFVRGDARAITAVSEMLSRRLEVTTRGRQPTRRTLTIAVVSRSGQRGASLIATVLADALEAHPKRRVRRLEVSDSGAPMDTLLADAAGYADTVVTVARERSVGDTLVALSSVLERLCVDRPIVVLDVPARAGLDAEALTRFVDVVIDVAGDEPSLRPRDAHTRVLRVRNLLANPTERVPRGDVEPFVLPLDRSIAGLSAREAADAIRADAWSPLARTLGRLGRAVEGRVVGVALGAGAALGLAHIGVLRELERAGIPVDVLAGSSMGAVVALGYATGARADALEATARRLSSFRRLVGTVDLATTSDGLLAGRRLMTYLRPFLQGATTFDDLVLPARAVATDLANGVQVAIDEGSLEQAMRASIAMPPFVTPVLTGDRTLVDGGIINPIPVQVVRDMGADVVIAVNAVPPLDANSATVLTRVSRGLNRINPLAYLTGRLHSLNLLDLVMHSFQVVEHELGSYMAQSADVFIRPDLGAHTWIEFYRAPEIIEHGADATRTAIEQIDDVLSRRLEAAVPAA